MKTFAADRQPGDFILPQGSSALKYHLALFRKFVSAVVNALVYDYRKLSRFAEVAAVPGFLDLCLCPVSALLTTFGTPRLTKHLVNWRWRPIYTKVRPVQPSGD